MSEGGRYEQDRVVAQIVAEFSDCPKAPSVKDRRRQPSHGYRAVHVVVYLDNMPVEIQVRTTMQDAWAQITESLGDLWGRGLRYGLPPDEPDRPVAPASPGHPAGSLTTRQQLVDGVGRFGDLISAVEEAEYELHEVALVIDRADADRRAHLEERVRALDARLLGFREQLEGMVASSRPLPRQQEATNEPLPRGVRPPSQQDPRPP